jgi:hypothetical protein
MASYREALLAEWRTVPEEAEALRSLAKLHHLQGDQPAAAAYARRALVLHDRYQTDPKLLQRLLAIAEGHDAQEAGR